MNCQYYDRQADKSDGKGPAWGQCRRTAPSLSPINAKSYMIEGVWPTVRDDDWCGEWTASNRSPESSATAAMSSLMQSAAAAARPASQMPVFVATEASEPVHPPISTLMRGPIGSD